MTKLEVLEAVSWPAEPGSPTAGPPPPGSTEGQDRLIAAYDHAGVGIAEVDGEGTLLRVNAHLCRLTGYSSRELLGGSIFAGSHPEDVETDPLFGRLMDTIKDDLPGRAQTTLKLVTSDQKP